MAGDFGGELFNTLSGNFSDLDKYLQSQNEVPIDVTAPMNLFQQLPPLPLQPAPTHLERFPLLDIVKSEYSFDVTTAPDNSQLEFRNQKLFIKMNAVVNFMVSFKPQYCDEQMFVRAMIIYTKPNEMHLPVKRCANHRLTAKENSDHILKCCHPTAEYHGSEDGKIFRDRLSVLLPLSNLPEDENGIMSESLGFEFGCQNSCSSGINRRATSIIFTLENQYGHIRGKSAIQFKVCTCPKRDADRENMTKRKGGDSQAFPRGKRPKMPPFEMKQEPDDSDMENPEGMSTINLSVPTELVPEILRAAFNVVAGKLALDCNSTSASAVYTQTMRTIKRLLESVSDDE